MTDPSLDAAALEKALDAYLACRPESRVAVQDFGMQQRDILRQQTEAAIAAYLAALASPAQVEAEAVGYASPAMLSAMKAGLADHTNLHVRPTLEMKQPLYAKPQTSDDVVRTLELSAEDAALIRQLWAENKHDEPARTFVSSDKDMNQAMRLSELGLVGIEQKATGFRLHGTRLGLRSLPENAALKKEEA